MKTKTPLDRLNEARVNFDRAGHWIKAQNNGSLGEALNLRITGAHWGDGSMLFQNAFKRAILANLSSLVKEALELLERDIDEVKTSIATEIGTAAGLEASDDLDEGASHHGSTSRTIARLRESTIESGLEPQAASSRARKGPLAQAR